MKYIYFLIILLIISNSCSPKIIRTGEKSTKSDFAIKSPSKAVFFVENKKIEAEKHKVNLHTKTADKIYNQFNLSTDAVVIGRTNAKTFKFSNDEKIWFLAVSDLKMRTAMILFDGNSKPLVEYDPAKYESLVNTYLGADLKKSQELRRENLKTTTQAANILDSIWAIPFVPNKKYADAVINLSQAGYYSTIYLPKCEGTIKSNIYSDKALKNLTQISTTTYDKGRIVSSERTVNKEKYQSKNTLNNVGLIDFSILSINGKVENSTFFKYLPDRYVTKNSHNKKRDEFLFDDQKRVSKKLTYDESNQISDERLYYYDNFNRLIREESVYAGKKNMIIIYEYDNAKVKQFSKTRILDANQKVISESSRIFANGKETFITEIDGKIKSKTISEMGEDCLGKMTVLNDKNEVISVVVQEKL